LVTLGQKVLVVFFYKGGTDGGVKTRQLNKFSSALEIALFFIHSRWLQPTGAGK
jgi:hypothetical protein